MQNETLELDALIVESMTDLEDAYHQFNTVEARVFTAMGDLARVWSRDNAWFGTFDYQSEGLKLAPESWRVEGETQLQAKAWFHLGHGDGDPGNEDPQGDAWDLTRLCQLRSGILCFQAWPDWKIHGLKAPAWKRAARAQADVLYKAGFAIGSTGTILRQIKIEQNALVEAVRAQAIEDALSPFEAALDQLKVAVPVVEAVLAAAKA